MEKLSQIKQNNVTYLHVTFPPRIKIGHSCNGCFHSFHNAYLKRLTSCPLCKDFLKEKVKDLGEIEKKAILNPASITHVPETQMNDSGEVLTDDSPQ